LIDLPEVQSKGMDNPKMIKIKTAKKLSYTANEAILLPKTGRK
jgi:hypothetical protein